MTADFTPELLEAMESLTVKQRLFVESYLHNDYNGSKAILDAGYKTSNPRQMASEMIRKPHIKACIELYAEHKAKELRIEPEYVLKKLMATIEKAEKTDNHNAVLRGLELAARHLGMLTDKQEITGKDGAAIKYEEVKNEAADFTRAISGLAERSRKGGDSLKVVSGGKGSS